jgi:hypothetical protein
MQLTWHASLASAARCARASLRRLRCAAAAKMRAYGVCIISPLFDIYVFGVYLQVSTRACGAHPPPPLPSFLPPSPPSPPSPLSHPPCQVERSKTSTLRISLASERSEGDARDLYIDFPDRMCWLGLGFRV